MRSSVSSFVALLLTAFLGCSDSPPAGQIVYGHQLERVDRVASAASESAITVPLEVDLAAAETFVRIGYAIERSQRFQSTEFRTPRLSTSQAQHLIRLVKDYNNFRGEAVADALTQFKGRVSGIEFGREGSPVIYVELPYWTHQREGVKVVGSGVRISESDHQALVSELRGVFIGQLSADEFSEQKRRVRVWWD